MFKKILALAAILLAACTGPKTDVNPDCVDDNCEIIETARVPFMVDTTVGSLEYGKFDDCEIKFESLADPNDVVIAETGTEAMLAENTCYTVEVNGGTHGYNGGDYAIREPDQTICTVLAEDVDLDPEWSYHVASMDPSIVDKWFRVDMVSVDNTNVTDFFQTERGDADWNEQFQATCFDLGNYGSLCLDGDNKITWHKPSGDYESLDGTVGVTNALIDFQYQGREHWNVSVSIRD